MEPNLSWYKKYQKIIEAENLDRKIKMDSLAIGNQYVTWTHSVEVVIYEIVAVDRMNDFVKVKFLQTHAFRQHTPPTPFELVTRFYGDPAPSPNTILKISSVSMSKYCLPADLATSDQIKEVEMQIIEDLLNQ